MSVTRRSLPPEIEPDGPQSLLGVDVGSAFTKASLFEPVDGRYRLIARGQARTTASSHVFNGLVEACQQVESLTGRQLASGGEPLAGDASGGRGVDVLAVSLSRQRPLRVLATNAAAAESAAAEPAHVMTLAAGPLRERVAQLADSEWDAIVGPADEVELAAQCLGRPFDAPRPLLVTGDDSYIRQELSALSLRMAVEAVAGMAELEGAATLPLTTGAAALLNLARLIAGRYGLRLAIADAGAAHFALAYASAQEERLRSSERDQLDLDLPVSATDMRELHERLERLLSMAPAGLSADLVLATGALARFSRWSETALTLLNGLQPAGVVQFAVDSAAVISQIAPLAAAHPGIACQLFEHDGLVGLGAAVCPRGDVKKGSKAIEVRWQGDEEVEESRQVDSGELVCLPLPVGEKANLSLYPAKGVDVGLNRPGVAATAHVDGGRVGLLVDARLTPADKGSNREHWETALA